MRHVSILLGLGLAACSPQGTPRDPAADPSANAIDAEVAAVINLQDRTEIEILKDRVVALEREVGELKANPQSLDLDLLTKRVETLEAASASTAAAPAPEPRMPQTDSESARRAVDAAINERRTKRATQD